MNDFLDCCREVVGSNHVLTDSADTAAFLTEWRQRFTGRALAVVRPGSTADVAKIVKLCNRFRVSLVPQGGNTGLVMGSIPDASATSIVLSLTRLNRIRAIDPANNTMTVEAGCVLQNIQQAAESAGRLFPLSLAAEGSCTIGGNLSTNAGGTAVLRYGNARELCLGLEVVTAQGEVWEGLRGLRKDNTGYDLRDLFIGAEGTLGVITAAVLKLFPQPKGRLTMLAAMREPQEALDLLLLAQAHCGANLTGFELLSDFCLQLVGKHFPQLQLPFSARFPYYALLEICDGESIEQAQSSMDRLSADAYEKKLTQDAALASSLSQANALWSLREHIPLAQAAEGKNIKHDISLPLSSIPDFIRVTDSLLQAEYPGCRMVTFGHLGDGNLHYNVAAPSGISDDAFMVHQTLVNRIVHDSVHRFGGSISAEHGIGMLKREEILRYKSEVELNMMRTIKQALDPLNLMNPGKVLI
jgi:FAD/FMN-containing dehydrogenase